MDETDLGDHRVRDSVLSGSLKGRVPPRPRHEIAASWRRAAAAGLDPARANTIPPLSGSELARRRTESGLRDLIPRLTASLSSVIDAGQLVVVADAEGRLLWRIGGNHARSRADDAGFIDGSEWTESNVGTNAIGTAIVLGSGVQVRGAEHFAESNLGWGCVAAPLTDPWSGRTLGVLDVSGPTKLLHPAELALVELTSRLTSMELVERHRDDLDRLRARVSPLLARISGEALAVDRYGHLAASVGGHAPDRVALPDALAPGQIWLPGLGLVTAEPIDEGWLLHREADADVVASRLVLDLTGDPKVRVSGRTGDWSRRLSARHAEILLSLQLAGSDGRTAAQLSDDLFAAPDRVVTVRAEMSRLRRLLGSVLISGPYRYAPGLDTELALPSDLRRVLPRSTAPVVSRLVDQPRDPGDLGAVSD